jgi:8-oxo-dGTP pyrophosphatase MutT (NUDIX family)
MARSCSTSVSSASRSRTELAQALRSVLLDAGEAAALDVHGRIDAAVLVPLYVSGGELHAVFTRRREDLRRHPGEISFPGGRQDFPDEDLRVTALREAEEEIGLPRDDVELIGALPPTGTFVTGYRIHPFVGAIKAGHEWTMQPNEVELILELSLPDLMRGFEMKRLIRKGVPIKTPTYSVDGNMVWGATARIVQHLLERLEPVLRS